MRNPAEVIAKVRVRPRYVIVAGSLLLAAIMALSTTYVPADQDDSGPESFDPDAFGAETFPRVVEALEESAVALPELLAAIEDDTQAAGEEFGNRGDVASPYSFPVRGTGVAGEPDGSLLPIEVGGVPDQTDVQIQIGPVLRGTTLRDTVDFVNFDQFVNQLEYADAGRALNDQVLAQTLAGLEPDQLADSEVSFVGAFTMLTPDTITITPVRLEVAPS